MDRPQSYLAPVTRNTYCFTEILGKNSSSIPNLPRFCPGTCAVLCSDTDLGRLEREIQSSLPPDFTVSLLRANGWLLSTRPRLKTCNWKENLLADISKSTCTSDETPPDTRADPSNPQAVWTASWPWAVRFVYYNQVQRSVTAGAQLKDLYEATPTSHLQIIYFSINSSAQTSVTTAPSILNFTALSGIAGTNSTGISGNLHCC